MIRTAVAPRPARAGATLAAVAGIVLLAGCAPADTDTSDDASTDTGNGSSGPDGAAPHADGTYTADGSYQTPESVETISVTVTLEDDVVTDVKVVGDPQKSESEQYQGQF